MACQKRQYPSLRKAELAMYNHWRRPRTGKMPVRAYKCPACSNWHLTSQPLRNAG